MAPLAATAGAGDLGADHAVAGIADFAHMRRVERGEEAGPAGAGIELGARAEQRQRTQPAAVDTLALVVEEDSAERRFGAVLQQHAALLAAEAGNQRLGLGGGGGRQVEGSHAGSPWVVAWGCLRKWGWRPGLASVMAVHGRHTGAGAR
ncbi:hypothetical protein G6F22_020255 [Rhizopus arrhizus]|nr:hypothetical protein G6F22_020255 [Rhizopus arrhizus]